MPAGRVPSRLTGEPRRFANLADQQIVKPEVWLALAVAQIPLIGFLQAFGERRQAHAKETKHSLSPTLTIVLTAAVQIAAH